MAIHGLPWFCAFDHVNALSECTGPNMLDYLNNFTTVETLGGIRYLSVEVTTSGVAYIDLDATYTQIVAGMRFRVDDAAYATALMEFWGSGTKQMNLRQNGASLEIRRDSTVLATVGGVFSNNTPVFLEFAVDQDASAGEWYCWVDGSLVASGTGVNTGANAMDRVYYHNGGTVYSDESIGTLYCKEWDSVSDPGHLGPINFVYCPPNSDVANAWDPDSGATNYTQVDDTPHDGDTSYVETDVDAEVEQYGLDVSAVPSSSIEILAVVPAAVIKSPNTGVVSIDLGLDDGTADYDATVKTVATNAYKGALGKAHQTMPSGGSITPANVGSLDLIMRSQV